MDGGALAITVEAFSQVIHSQLGRASLAEHYVPIVVV